MDQERAKTHPAYEPGGSLLRMGPDEAGGVSDRGPMGRKVPLDRPGQGKPSTAPMNPKAAAGQVDKPDSPGGFIGGGKKKGR
jgi:hypothetical protein